MKHYAAIASAAGLLVALMILSGCQSFVPSALPTASPTITPPPTYTPTPVAPTATIIPTVVTPPATTPSPVSTPDLTLSDDEILDIAVVVLRYMTNYNDASRDARPVVYLTLFGKDPSPEFLAKFANMGERIKGGSEFEKGKGLQFYIDNVKQISKNRAKVSAGYYEGPLSAAGYIYILERQDGEWVVIDKRLEWIA